MSAIDLTPFLIAAILFLTIAGWVLFFRQRKISREWQLSAECWRASAIEQRQNYTASLRRIADRAKRYTEGEEWKEGGE
jgi:hypothetical protein